MSNTSTLGDHYFRLENKVDEVYDIVEIRLESVSGKIVKHSDFMNKVRTGQVIIIDIPVNSKQHCLGVGNAGLLRSDGKGYLVIVEDLDRRKATGNITAKGKKMLITITNIS